MDTNIFYLEGNTLHFNTHKVTVRHYGLDSNGEADKSVYKDDVQYVNADGLYELEVNFVPKHKLLEIVDKEELDTSEYAWLDGIEIDPNGDRAKQIEKVYSYGSLEAYEASLEESQDAFNLDVDYRLSKIELGI